MREFFLRVGTARKKKKKCEEREGNRREGTRKSSRPGTTYDVYVEYYKARRKGGRYGRLIRYFRRTFFSNFARKH